MTTKRIRKLPAGKMIFEVAWEMSPEEEKTYLFLTHTKEVTIPAKRKIRTPGGRVLNLTYLPLRVAGEFEVFLVPAQMAEMIADNTPSIYRAVRDPVSTNFKLEFLDDYPWIHKLENTLGAVAEIHTQHIDEMPEDAAEMLRQAKALLRLAWNRVRSKNRENYLETPE